MGCLGNGVETPLSNTPAPQYPPPVTAPFSELLFLSSRYALFRIEVNRDLWNRQRAFFEGFTQLKNSVNELKNLLSDFFR
jgi:hypothetical protein